MADFTQCFENRWKNENDLTVSTMDTLNTLDWLKRPPMVEEIEENEDDEIAEPQVWNDFEETTERFRKSLYYGRTPPSDRLSLPVTELCVSRFNDLGLEEIETKLNRLDVNRAAEITRETCSSPTSLVLALMYLDRLRSGNAKYLSTISSTDLFLVSLMVASKYLYDDGEEDEVFNDEWATSGNMDKKELNRMELDFLSAIDWNIYISPDDYETAAKQLEWAVAVKKVEERPGNWTTYTEANVLSRNLDLIKLWQMFYEYTLKVTAVCAFAYAASVMTMIGTCHLLSRTQVFSPPSLQSSLQNLYGNTAWKDKSMPDKDGVDEQDASVNNPEDDIEALSEKMRLSKEFTNETVTENQEDFALFCQDPAASDFCEKDIMVNRLARALFALKIGSFRDLMLGPQIIT